MTKFLFFRFVLPPIAFDIVPSGNHEVSLSWDGGGDDQLAAKTVCDTIMFLDMDKTSPGIRGTHIRSDLSKCIINTMIQSTI